MTFEKAASAIGKAHLDAKIQVLTDMLDEIKQQEYMSVAQVRVSMLKQIENFKKLRVEHE